MQVYTFWVKETTRIYDFVAGFVIHVFGDKKVFPNIMRNNIQ